MALPLRVLPAGDTALVLELGETIDAGLNALVHALDKELREARPKGLVETVPTYRSILVHFDPLETDAETLAVIARDLATRVENVTVTATRRYRIPVAFGGERGIDLDDVAKRVGLSTKALIETHAAADYRVYMLGFSPGFAYLGGLPPALALPRRDSPRLATPAGTFMQGGQQAALSPSEMPSGWHLLGQSPLRLFDLRREAPFLLGPGDLLRVVPIDGDRYEALAREVAIRPIDPESEPVP
ncbi:MAG: 5-oxoprolinase subunit PxpB [Alphaproteobacteria bacterium]|nr:5-oxoprolinase subunit PxpB [Alphaproteobacteria bacterium]